MRIRPLLPSAAVLLLAACASTPASEPAAASAPQQRQENERLHTESRTQSMRNAVGAEIYVRNRATVPIRVTSVTLESCIGIADPCGTTHPRVVINPGDERRVMRVRFIEKVANSYRYTYRVERAP